MAEPWFPRGLGISDGARLQGLIADGGSWQIYGLASGGSRALVVAESTARQWQACGALMPHQMQAFQFGDRSFQVLINSHGALAPVGDLSPQTIEDALQFSQSLARTRSLGFTECLESAVYVERYSLILPSSDFVGAMTDDMILGRYLARGVEISCFSNRRLASLVPPWLKGEIGKIIEAAKLPVPQIEGESTEGQSGDKPRTPVAKPVEFRLHGRPHLEQFFRDHVIDIVENRERYKKLGIDFPSAIMLHGPPGCGKTYAVERLVEYLDWPEFSIDASSIASPYIHDTSRKIAGVFEQAMQQKPSVIVMDEIDAFVMSRSGGDSGQHHVEEVAEFLRRIPEAIANQVLVIGMTNRVELIDPAIMRRGRFDHIVEVPMASVEEVRYLLDHLLAEKPCSKDLDPAAYADALAGRPLSDVSFLVREAARLTAKHSKDAIDDHSIRSALAEMSNVSREPPKKRGIGFLAEDVS